MPTAPRRLLRSPFDAAVVKKSATTIADKLDQLPQDERLMNLSQVIPPGFSRFQSLIEVVGRDEADRESARERVKFYKDRGYEVRYFDLSER